MKILQKNHFLFILTLSLTTTVTCLAQEGQLTVNQDQKIDRLLDLKKGMNAETTDRYKIQIYSGHRSSAQTTKGNFLSKYSNWTASMVFETPNYKIWIGNFRTRLEADRALKKIKKSFSGAFIFKPKKK